MVRSNVMLAAGCWCLGAWVVGQWRCAEWFGGAAGE